jgi:hypothetical protein
MTSKIGPREQALRAREALARTPSTGPQAGRTTRTGSRRAATCSGGTRPG